MTIEHFRIKKTTPIANTLSDYGIKSGDTRQLNINAIAAFGNTMQGDLCFCDRQPNDDTELAEGSIIMCSAELEKYLNTMFPSVIPLVCPDPRAAFIDLCKALHLKGQLEVNARIPRPFGVHRMTRIAHSAYIHPETVIEEGAVIGEHCVIHRGSWIKAYSVIHDNTIVGADGITMYLGKDGKHRKFPHIAGVVIGENAEVGANVVISKGILNDTVIGAGSVIGNLCNIGHVAQLGEMVWMSVGCLIGGHALIGERVSLGMGVAVRDNVSLGANVQVGMGSVIVKSIQKGTSVIGNPARIVPSLNAGPKR